MARSQSDDVTPDASGVGPASALPPGVYDPWPTHPLPSGRILPDFDALAGQIARGLATRQRMLIDGSPVVDWDRFCRWLDATLTLRGFRARWLDVRACLLPSDELEALVGPYLGGDDPLFGYRCRLRLEDFFVRDRLDRLAVEAAASSGPVVVLGPGAALTDVDGYLAYVDVPKDEQQRRLKQGSAANLGAAPGVDFGAAYKRAYFVDWPVFNRHIRDLVPRLDLVVDGHSEDKPTAVTGDDLRAGLTHLATNVFRVRPWFAPGPWGGQWLKRHVPGIPQDAPNYAWSFELITPENGVVFERDGATLEVAFDWLMAHAHEPVLGRAADRFGFDFPIRFDYLDTIDGGNLSIQCHPSPTYIRERFGEPFTQDETYYVVRNQPGARVYLGFQPDADPDEFRRAVERSAATGDPVPVDRFVQSLPSEAHALYLIPHGTIHASGAGNLVLEISATPYIYTFKIYDWVRRDLEGKLRPLNIERAWENLRFDRRGARVPEELVAQPRVIDRGADWQTVHLPTHPDHFYDVHRIEFQSTVPVATEERCHVLNLVAGRSLILETAGGERRRCNAHETFVVPAAAGSYRLTSEDGARCWVVKAFVK